MSGFGGVESFVKQPVLLTHYGLGAEEHRRRGLTNSMVRLPVALEAPADSIADLEKALE